jgi:hypothetical protein
MDHNAQGRRPHFHRGRRGSDRRGGDRRTPQPAPEHSPRGGSDHVDVEQIMRDIRARIAQRHGIELSTQQIQELAARRLEAILDPRTMSPALIEQLRRGAGTPAEVPQSAIDGGYTFEESTLYETHRGLLRFIRRLLHPILKLFFNPNPLVQALNTQAALNKQAAARETEREGRQAEWNALHYEILNRLVTEVSRSAVEVQALSMRIESLAARVDFNDRKVRALENATPPPRQHQPRPAETPVQPPPSVAVEPVASVSAVPGEPPPADGAPRRKRRRRRGRRSGGGIPGAAPSAETTPLQGSPSDTDEGDTDETEDYEIAEVPADDRPGVDTAPEPAPITVAQEQPPLVAEVETPPVVAQVETPRPVEPIQPTPPPDEPMPAAPVDHPDPGPPDR